MEDESNNGAMPEKRGRASFCVPRAAVQALISSDRVKVKHICLYLCIACGTQEDGERSTWGLSSLRERFGGKELLNSKWAKGVAALLREIKVSGQRIFYSASEWTAATGEVLRQDYPGKIEYVLPSLGETRSEMVWFDSDLVGPRGSSPLKKLNDLGDKAAKLLLSLHLKADMSRWGGVDPAILSRRYVRAKGKKKTVTRAESLAATFERWDAKFKATKRHGRMAGLWPVLAKLVGAGFFYEVATLVNREDPDDEDALYYLDVSYKPKVSVTEPMIGPLVAKTMRAIGESVAGKEDVLYTVANPGQECALVGVFRPRYRVANSKNAFSTDWIKFRRRCHRDAAMLLMASLANRKGVPEDLINDLRKIAPPPKRLEMSDYEKGQILKEEAEGWE